MVPEPEITIGEEKVEEEEDLDKDIIVVVEVPECEARQAVPFVSPAKLEVAPFVVETSTFAPTLAFDAQVATNVMTRDSFIDTGHKREFGAYRFDFLRLFSSLLVITTFDFPTHSNIYNLDF